jgi:sec-independent protein translocase protein TatA
MFGDLSFSHILILLLILVLVFGARRIPEIGASLGQGIKEFKKSLRDVTDDRSEQRNFQAPPPAAGVPPTKGGEPKRLSE